MNRSLTRILALLNAWNKLCNIDIFKCIHKLHILSEIKEDNFLFLYWRYFSINFRARYRIKIIFRSLLNFSTLYSHIMTSFRADCLKI